MKKIVVAVAIAAASLAGASNAHANALERVKERGTLICGISSASPPFGYLDTKTNQIVGFEVDLCRMLADSLAVKAELKEVTGASKVPELVQGRIDVLSQLLQWTAERAEIVDFSGQYLREAFAFLVLDESPIKTVDELNGKRVAVVAGSFLEPMIPVRLPNATVVALENQPSNFLAIQTGRVDGWAARLSQAKSLEFDSDGTKPLRQLEEPLTTGASAFGVQKGEKEWLEYLNGFLAEIEKNGKGQELWDKWLGSKSDYGFERKFAYGGDPK